MHFIIGTYMKKAIQSTLSAALSLLLAVSLLSFSVQAKNSQDPKPEPVPAVQTDEKQDENQKEESEDEPKKEKVPAIQKAIVDTDGLETNSSWVRPGECATFRLTSNVPQNLFNYVTKVIRTNPDDQTDVQIEGEYTLTFHDDLADELILDPDSIMVRIGNSVLSREDFILDQEHQKHTEERICDFHVSLDLISLFNKRAFFYQEINSAENIVVEYKARLDEKEITGSYTNHAWVSFPDNETVIEFVTLNLYGLQIEKVDAADPELKLEGAEFELRKLGSQSSEAVLVTDKTGKAQVTGLASGEYELIETRAPTGYIRSTKPVSVLISEQDKGDKNFFYRQIENNKAPAAGGTGTVLFAVVGSSLIAASLIGLLAGRRRENGHEM